MFRAATVIALGITFVFSATLQAEGVLQAHIKAVGGKDAIANIKTVHRTGIVSGQSSYGPLSGKIEQILDLSKNRGYTSMQLPGYSREAGWSGKSAWARDTQAGLTDLSAEEASYKKYLAGPSPLVAIETQFGSQACKEAGEKTFNGKKCVVVTVEGYEGEFYVNQQTNLLEGTLISGIESTFEDYEAVEGVQFAGKITVKMEAENLTMVHDLKTTKINSKIDASKFKRPSGTTPTPEPAAATGRITAEQIISYLDKDGDGKISKDEASQELKPNFQSIDTNGDGVIDVKEAQIIAKYAQNQPASSAEPAAGSQRVTATQLIRSMDSNRDGKISKQEASEDLRLFFGDYDKNKDGAIDAKEAQLIANYVNGGQAASSEPAAAGQQLTAKQIISYMDTDGDGKISKDEASDELKPNFQFIDANGDGVIDLKEAQVMAEYANQQRGG